MGEHPNLDELSDLTTPWSVHVVATLRIADHLAAGVTDADDLAAAAKCDADSLVRVMRHLVGKGLFTEPEPGRFALNDAARGLLDPARHMSLDLDGVGGRMAHAWGTLLTAVRTGSPAYAAVFGLPWWEDLAAHPAIGADFDALMGPTGHGTPDPEVLVTGDWDAVRTVVDVGGGTGAMLTEILRAHPSVHGTLVDLPSTVARCPSTDRLTAVGQSFFDPLPAGADLYLLKSVLNDWPDTESLAVLTRCTQAVAPTGRIVVIGGVTPNDEPAGLSVEMVLLGGRSRSLDEFHVLAAEAGLVVEATGRQPTGRFVVQCRRAV